MQINQGIGAGFGEFFFNAADPAVAKTNVPIKKDASKHIGILIATLFLAGMIGAGIGVT